MNKVLIIDYMTKVQECNYAETLAKVRNELGRSKSKVSAVFYDEMQYSLRRSLWKNPKNLKIDGQRIAKEFDTVVTFNRELSNYTLKGDMYKRFNQEITLTGLLRLDYFEKMDYIIINSDKYNAAESDDQKLCWQEVLKEEKSLEGVISLERKRILEPIRQQEESARTLAKYIKRPISISPKIASLFQGPGPVDIPRLIKLISLENPETFEQILAVMTLSGIDTKAVEEIRKKFKI